MSLLLRALILVLLLLVVYAPFSGELDLAVSRYFYHNGFHSNVFFDFLYNWGVLPGLFIAVGAGCVFLASYVKPKLYRFRSDALVLFLSLAIGSGILVHAVFKDHWGRPRPKQVVEFGGNQEFRPFYKPHFDNLQPSKSFSCGHCTVGFYFLVLIFVGRAAQKRWIEMSGWILGIGMGVLLSLTRIVQGGHWLSDTIISALIMVFTAWACALIFYREWDDT